MDTKKLRSKLPWIRFNSRQIQSIEIRKWYQVHMGHRGELFIPDEDGMPVLIVDDETPSHALPAMFRICIAHVDHDVRYFEGAPDEI